MRFLADENIKSKLVKFLIDLGHDIVFAEKSLKNSKLIGFAKEETRVLLTHDHDFLNTALFPPEQYAGIVVLCIHPPELGALKSSLSELLDKFAPEEFSGKLFIISGEGVEIVKE